MPFSGVSSLDLGRASPCGPFFCPQAVLHAGRGLTGVAPVIICPQIITGFLTRLPALRFPEFLSSRDTWRRRLDGQKPDRPARPSKDCRPCPTRPPRTEENTPEIN